MMPVISAVSRSNASIPVSGIPLLMSPRSSRSDAARRNWPLRRSTPAMPSPASPWQVTHCER